MLRTKTGCAMVLLGAMGIATNATAMGENNASAAEKRGLSPIILSADSGTRAILATHILNAANKDVALSALFGNGGPANNNADTAGLVSQVHIGGSGTDQNTYADMRAILAALGVTANSNVSPHNTHFHLFLNPPQSVGITALQLAATPADAAQTQTANVADLQTAAQTLLNQIQSETQQETLMFIMDVPNIPAQEAPLMVADATAAQGSAQQQYDRVIGVCHLSESPFVPQSAVNVMEPSMEAKDYFRKKEQYKIEGQPLVSVLQMPAHGSLVNEGEGYFAYYPENGYIGNDRASLLVEMGGKKIRMEYFFRVMQTVPDQEGVNPYADYCPNKVRVWKISSITDSNGNKYISAVAYQSPAATATANGTTATDAGSANMDTAALNAALGSSILDSLTAGTPGITVNLANLTGGAVGQDVGTNITLDTNAAGYNWFIDTTPADNSEFLATSNPNEWVAKAGSDAAGKMDMLSVLLHEYGHALGIEHSADSGDYMGTTLTVGVRRLPSATELALMQQLIGQAKGEMIASTLSPTLPLQGGGGLPLDLPISMGGLAFAGLLRPNRYGSSSIDVVSTQYEAAANATFTNLDTAGAWQTQGSVDITPSSFDTSGRTVVSTATLNEISTSQTRLSQVFMLNDKDRYLSFTLAGSALDNPTGAPEDAFEVALLDASTGASVLTGDGLTRTDAFLNLQGDGTQNAADCVTCIYNADGSRTYRVDLTGVAKNIAVNLSFDLLGFGAANSHVTLRDIRTSGLPQLRDDVATIAEDNLLTFDPFAQADAQLKPLLASHIVAAPTHGALVMNADGTFSYTPDLNYFGADSFSYNLSDGSLDSNLAAVSLTVTPVNDAPVVADVQATTAEDTALVIALGAYASDVDSTPPLTRGGGEGFATQIVTGPAHGVLVANADGTYSYTPDANYNGADSFTYKANDGELDSNIATVSLNVTPVNDAPVAGDLNLAAVEDTAFKMNLLVAASDVENDALTAAIVATAQHGQVSINADGSFTYTPVANYNGTDSFTYKVNDGALDSNVATVNLSIAAVNDAPVVADVQATTAEDTK